MLKSIKARLTAASAGIVIAAIALATVTSYRTVRNTVMRDVAQQLADAGDTQAAAIAAWVRTQKNVVRALGPVLDQADPNPALQQAQTSGVLDMAYMGTADKRMVSIPARPRAADYDPTVRPWYKAAAAAREPVLTAPYIATSTQKLVVTFATAVRQGDEVRGVVGSDVPLDEVVERLNKIRPTPSGFALLADREGRIIAHPDPKYTLKPLAELSPELSAAVLGQAAATLTELRVGAQQVFVKSAPIQGTDWLLISAADRGEALASLSELLRNAGIALVLVVLGAVAVSTWLVRRLLGRLVSVRNAMEQIGSAGGGDLTQRLDEQGEDELTDIAHAFNQFVGQIEHVMRDVRSSAESIATASREIAMGAQDLSARTEQTASNLEETASAMEHLTETVHRSAASAGSASAHAGNSAEVAQRGGAVVGRVVRTMDEISASSRKIGDIIGVIDGIAFQTNILALNAAVEAARAGEQGRGFAVVAGEVRSLAQRSAEAAKEIKTLIGGSMARVDEGAQLVAEAGRTMDEILASVRGVSDTIGEISSGATEQSRGIVEINQAVSQLDQMTQQNAALVEESAAAADSLKDQAARLSQVVGTFRLGGV
ncbi:methyl-accepting chemotaxis protein [Pelomonas sp. CA6]|uniref:methyl-accepting chemotaxis protein n=1 Tax=Pelomonas sp. CA6 TaxID=2907999 RepID=UPI0024086F6C|nr:methyl-accepting chemotaxis protein [Pelomonas sp. CA6]